MQLSPGLDIVTLEQLRSLNDRSLAEAVMRARCMVVPINPITAICRVLGRYKMYVDLRDVGFGPHLMFEGFWEYWITDFIWRNVEPGGVVVDVGANHGYYTLLLADLVGPSGKVHAFEPSPRLIELLGRTVSLNGFWNTVAVHAAAAGEVSGDTMRFVSSDEEPKNGRLLLPHEPSPDSTGEPGLHLQQVPVVALDDVLPGRVDFLKIDVEGAEELVWRGMQGIVARNPAVRIVMEFNPGRCSTPAATLRSMATTFMLREIGFDAVARTCTIEEVMSRREDTILYLSRDDPA